jgi:hypothetical protein
MKKIYHVLSLSALTFALSAITAPPVLACGPSFIQPVFAMTARPEQFADFAKGNVGIVHPTFYRSALFAAYRAFNNTPFSDKEQQELIRNWLAEYENKDANDAIKSTAINNWVAARKKIATGEEPKIYADRNNPDSYSSFVNCTAGAFDNAVKTLTSRLDGNKVEDVKEWLRGQDAVFANCSEVKEPPSALAADAPQWLKDDRAYQIAAAHFYAAQYEQAKTAFTEIANNKASPWRATSAYLLARIAIRQASALSDNEEQKAQMLMYYQQAENQLNNVLTDKSLASVHDAAKQLLNLITFRLHPEILHTELAKKLIDKSEDASLFQDLTDYRRLLDKAEMGEESSPESKTFNDQFRKQHELSDWIFTLQSTGQYTHALEKWQSLKSPAWLVAALMQASADSADVAKLIDAAKSLDKNSAAFLTANYHVVRLQIAQGQQDAARKILDSILNDGSIAMNVSARNQLLSQRLSLAQDLNEFVKFSQRKAVNFAYDQSELQLVDFATPPKAGEDDYAKNERAWLKRTMFDQDAARMMNQYLPLSLLKQLAVHPDLPDYLRAQVALSAWMRAVLLNDDASATALAPELGQLIPELKPFMASYTKAKDSKTKQYEAVWAMLKNPATRPIVDFGTGRQSAFGDIDDFRDNWWCILPNAAETATAPSFLSKEQLAQAKDENTKLAVSGSNFLATKTSEWAAFAPKETRLPEALALAVKATRYGCQNCDTGKASKAAFDILKARFATSDWKKKTPYWFKDEGCEVKK